MRMLIPMGQDELREFPFHTFQGAKALPFWNLVVLVALHVSLCAAKVCTARVASEKKTICILQM